MAAADCPINHEPRHLWILFLPLFSCLRLVQLRIAVVIQASAKRRRSCSISGFKTVGARCDKL